MVEELLEEYEKDILSSSKQAVLFSYTNKRHIIAIIRNYKLTEQIPLPKYININDVKNIRSYNLSKSCSYINLKNRIMYNDLCGIKMKDSELLSYYLEEQIRKISNSSTAVNLNDLVWSVTKHTGNKNLVFEALPNTNYIFKNDYIYLPEDVDIETYFDSINVYKPTIKVNATNFNEKQLIAAKYIEKNYLSVINAGPGTGKTYMARIIDGFVLCPTHAAKNLFISDGLHANTIHSFYFKTLKPDFKPEFGILIIDEFSMIGLSLMKMIISIINSNKFKRIIFMGDANQLESVTKGSFIDAYRGETLLLTENMRSNCKDIFTLASIVKLSKNKKLYLDQIIRLYNSMKINDGSVEIIYTNDVYKEINKITKNDNLLKNKVMTFTNAIKTKLNNSIYKFKHNKVFKSLFLVKGNVPIMCMNNIEEDFTNGSKHNLKVDKSILIDGKAKDINLNNFDLNYAQTVHKSQGEGYDTAYYVVAYDDNKLNKFLNYKMLYTAITRSKSKFVLIIDNKHNVLITNSKNVLARDIDSIS